MAETSGTGPAKAPAGIDAARITLRSAGYCVYCDRLVERDEHGGCSRAADHPAEGVSGVVWLAEGEPVPALPRFSVGAFLMPPVWGPAHGLWAGVIFLPLWVFADGAVASALERGGLATAGAVAIVTLTIVAQAWFAKRGPGLAWRRVCDRVSVAAFARSERWWAIAMVPVALLVFGWAAYYRFVVAG